MRLCHVRCVVMYVIAIRLAINKKSNIEGAIFDLFDIVVVVDLSVVGDFIDEVGTEQITSTVEADLVVDSSDKMAILVDFRNEFSLGLLSPLFATDRSFGDDIDGDSLTVTTADVNDAESIGKEEDDDDNNDADAADTEGLIVATAFFDASLS